jgi:hypothetical protein
MRHAVLTILVALGLGSVAVAQIASEQMTRLRQHISLPADVSLQPASLPSLPSERPLRLFLAFGLDLKVRDNFVRWVEEWNRGKGKKFGAIRIVADLADADAAIARWTDRSSVTTTTRTNPLTGLLQSETEVPATAYVLGRRGQGWEVLTSRTEMAWASPTKKSGKNVWEDFQRLLKASQP